MQKLLSSLLLLIWLRPTIADNHLYDNCKLETCRCWYGNCKLDLYRSWWLCHLLWWWSQDIWRLRHLQVSVRSLWCLRWCCWSQLTTTLLFFSELTSISYVPVRTTSLSVSSWSSWGLLTMSSAKHRLQIDLSPTEIVDLKSRRVSLVMSSMTEEVELTGLARLLTLLN